MKQMLCEALYALPEGDVVARRQTIYKPLMAIVLGVALLAVNVALVEDKAGALSMTLLVAGGVLAIYGAVAMLLRLCGSERVPYNVGANRYMRYRERYYERALLASLSRAVERGDSAAIDLLPTTNVSAIVLVEYRTPGNTLTAYAIYEYAEYEHRLLAGPFIKR